MRMAVILMFMLFSSCALFGPQRDYWAEAHAKYDNSPKYCTGIYNTNECRRQFAPISMEKWNAEMEYEKVRADRESDAAELALIPVTIVH